jgi:hypothetical protein
LEEPSQKGILNKSVDSNSTASSACQALIKEKYEKLLAIDARKLPLHISGFTFTSAHLLKKKSHIALVNKPRGQRYGYRGSRGLEVSAWNF